MGFPIYLDETDPQIDDPAVKAQDFRWQPGCKLTEKLVRCLEAFRDVKTAILPLSLAPKPDADKRKVKQAIVPVYNLAGAVRDLYNDLQSKGWPKIHPEERKKAIERFKRFQERANTKNGPLKVARDKIAAHLDKDVFAADPRGVWKGVNLSAVLSWIRASVELFMPMLTADVFSWTRESGDPKITRLMNVDGREVFLHTSEEHGLSLVRLNIVWSPKFGIEKEVRGLVAACLQIRENLEISGE